MSAFIKPLIQPKDPYYIRMIKGSDKLMPEFTGKNAAFDGGGSIGGSIVSNATLPLHDYTDYLYTASAASQYDYWSYTLNTDELSRQFGSLEFKFFYKTISTNFRICVKDMTSGNIITSGSVIATGTTTSSYVFNIPSTCLQLRIGFQYVGNTAGETLQFDNMLFNVWTPQAANLVINEAVSYTGYTSKDGSDRILFKTKDTLRSNESKLISVFSTGYIKYTILQDCNVIVSVGVDLNPAAASNLYLIHYNVAGTVVKRVRYLDNATSWTGSGISYPTKALAGDYFIATVGSAATDNDAANFSITASAISSNILQSWSDGTEWTALTYTQVNALVGNQGLGTFTAGGVEWMRGKDGLLHYKGKLTCGTVAASEIRVPFPTGLISADTTKIPSIQLAGYWVQAASSILSGAILAEPSVGYFTMGQQTTATGGLTKSNGNAPFGNGAVFSFFLTLPIQGWTNSPTIVALPTATQTEYYLEGAGNAAQVLTANVTDIPFIATVQNNLTWDGSGFTAPISGNYELCGNVYCTSTAQAIGAFVNGVVVKYLNSASLTSTRHAFSGKIYLTAGQRLSVRANVNTTISNDSGQHWIAITRLNGKNDGVMIGAAPKEQVVYLKEVQASGTNGGTFTSGAWQTRTLNTVVGDSSIVSLAANVFTLQPGEYDIEAIAPAWSVNLNMLGIALSASSTPDVATGISSYATITSIAEKVQTNAIVSARLSVLVPTSYKLVHRCATTSATSGFGLACSLGVSETFAQVKIRKLNGQ